VGDTHFPCRSSEGGGCPALPEDVPCWDSLDWEGISEVERSPGQKRRKKALKPSGGHQDALVMIFRSIGLQSSSALCRYRMRLGWVGKNGISTVSQLTEKCLGTTAVFCSLSSVLSTSTLNLWCMGTLLEYADGGRSPEQGVEWETKG